MQQVGTKTWHTGRVAEAPRKPKLLDRLHGHAFPPLRPQHQAIILQSDQPARFLPQRAQSRREGREESG
jgi:hypothetical protein